MIDSKGAPFAAIVIKYNDGTEEAMIPADGMHFIVMSWREADEDLPEKPGHLLMHCGADVACKMIDRLFHHHPNVWENINKLWAYQEHVMEAQRRLQDKLHKPLRKMEPKDGKWN
jgi:hypothetical protein